MGRGRRVCEGPAGDAGDRVGSVSLWGVCAGSAWACGVGGDVSRRTVRAARSRWQVWALLGPGSGTLGAGAGGEGARTQRAGCGTPGACGASAAGMHLALRLRVAGCTVRACVLSLQTLGREERGGPRSAPSHSPGAQPPFLASPPPAARFPLNLLPRDTRGPPLPLPREEPGGCRRGGAV